MDTFIELIWRFVTRLPRHRRRDVDANAAVCEAVRLTHIRILS
jgi:hypothetical protein